MNAYGSAVLGLQRAGYDCRASSVSAATRSASEPSALVAPAISVRCKSTTRSSTSGFRAVRLTTRAIVFDSYLHAPGGDLAPGCLIPFNGLFGAENFLTDRENVVNLHMGIPHKNGLRDDVQLLWSGSALKSYFLSAPNDAGPGATNFGLAKVGWYGYSPQGLGIVGPYRAQYTDAITYNLPFGSRVASCATVSTAGVCTGGLAVSPTQIYSQPNSPQHSFDGTIPDNLSDLTNNDTGIVKMQYTHALDPRSFIRAYAYTFFSDWTEDGPISGSSPLAFEYPFTGVAPNYDLITHTSGGQLQYTNQINDQNLIQLTGNYTQANVSRFNNTGYNAGSSPIGYISENNGVYSCWDPTTGGPSSNGCISGSTRAPRQAARPASRRRDRPRQEPAPNGRRSGTVTRPVRSTS